MVHIGVLSYKGDWFNYPNLDLAHLLDELYFLRLESGYMNTIRIFDIDLSKPKTESKT